jgi:antibiotic biosynthesis monooxygenase (ABM) superfamily enzyme
MKARRAFTIVFLAVLVATSVGLAQEKPKTYSWTMMVTVKPGAEEIFEDYLEKLAAAGEKTSAPQSWGVGQVAMGGPGRTYIGVIGFDKWAEADGWAMARNMLIEAYGEKEGLQILKSGSSAIESSHNRVSVLLADHSTHLGKRTSVAQMYMVTESEIKADMISEYEYLLSRVKAAEEAMPGSLPAIRRSTVLGPTAVYTAARPFDKFAEAESSPSQGEALRKMYGDIEAQKINDGVTRCIKSISISVVRFRPDLSYLPAATPTDN